MARIQVIEHQDASGALKVIYDDLLSRRGKLAEVHKIQSLNPATIVHHMELYIAIMYAHSPLSRAQREMMAVVVSAANGCSYCQVHHKQALQHYWKDEERVNLLAQDFTKPDLDPLDLCLCELAYCLTKTPEHEKVGSLIDELKGMGAEDRSILDAHLVIAYFNFVNRLVLGFGVELESDLGQGYKY